MHRVGAQIHLIRSFGNGGGENQLSHLADLAIKYPNTWGKYLDVVVSFGSLPTTGSNIHTKKIVFGLPIRSKSTFFELILILISSILFFKFYFRARNKTIIVYSTEAFLIALPLVFLHFGRSKLIYFRRSVIKSRIIINILILFKHLFPRLFGLATNSKDCVPIEFRAYFTLVNNYPSDFKNLNIKRKLNQLLFVGRLCDEKGVDEILNWFNKIKIAKDIKIIFVGEPISYLKKYPTSKTEGVEILGAIDRNKINELMSESSCLIVNSKFEGNSNVLIEAAICNCPVYSLNDPSIYGSFAFNIVNESEFKLILNGNKLVFDKVESNYKATISTMIASPDSTLGKIGKIL